MKFSIDNNEVRFESAEYHDFVDAESQLCEKIAEMLGEEDLSIAKKSGAYTTLLYKGHDFVRVKYTERAKWIKAMIESGSQYETDERFVQNRNEIYRKAELKSMDDIYEFKGAILESLEVVKRFV